MSRYKGLGTIASNLETVIKAMETKQDSVHMAMGTSVVAEDPPRMHLLQAKADTWGEAANLVKHCLKQHLDAKEDARAERTM